MAATVVMSPRKVEELDSLYRAACKRQRGFARRHRSTMTRLGKEKRVVITTVEALIADVEAVLGRASMSDDDARKLDALHAYVHAEQARDLDGLRKRVDTVVVAARAEHAKLATMGLPGSAVLVTGAPFVASAASAVAAIHDYLAGCGADLAPWTAPLACWATRLRELASTPSDTGPVEPRAATRTRANGPALPAQREREGPLSIDPAVRELLRLHAIEEAARLLEFACRIATECLARDHYAETITLAGPLVDPASPGQLSQVHLQGCIALDRWAYRQPQLIGAPEVAREWLARYPFALNVVVTRSLECVLGYLTVLPLRLDAVAEVLRCGDDAHIQGDRIAVCGVGEPMYLYIPSVVIRLDCNRRVVKNQLRASFLRALRWLRERGAEIEAIIAVGYTVSGRELLEQHGFTIADGLECRVGRGAALLDRKRRLYEMVSAVVPTTELGREIYAAAFGSMARAQPRK